MCTQKQSGEGGTEGEGERILCRLHAQHVGPTWSLISEPWDHDLSRKQMPNRLIHPSTLFLSFLNIFFWWADEPAISPSIFNVNTQYLFAARHQSRTSVSVLENRECRANDFYSMKAMIRDRGGSTCVMSSFAWWFHAIFKHQRLCNLFYSGT